MCILNVETYMGTYFEYVCIVHTSLIMIVDFLHFEYVKEILDTHGHLPVYVCMWFTLV